MNKPISQLKQGKVKITWRPPLAVAEWIRGAS